MVKQHTVHITNGAEKKNVKRKNKIKMYMHTKH